MQNMEINDLLHCCLKICSIKKKDDLFEIKDYNDEPLTDLNTIYGIYKNYRQSSSELKFQEFSYSTVWIMVNADDVNDKKIFQIGQSKSFKNMIDNDLKIDINGIISNFNAVSKSNHGQAEKYTKYVNAKSINNIEIYEVHIDEFLEKSCIALPIGVNKDFNEEMFFYVKSFIVEGAIGKMFNLNNKNSLWHYTGGLDGMFYNLK